MRRLLDALYAGCAWLAAGFLVSIVVLTFLIVLSRYTRGWVFVGGDAYAGYALAASSFLAFAYALARNDHIRVGLLVERLHGRARWWAELWCHAVGTGLAVWFAWYAVRMVWWSWTFHDVSQLNDATPLWIPQLGMAAGTVVLAIAFLDRLVQLLRGGAVPETPAGAGEPTADR